MKHFKRNTRMLLAVLLCASLLCGCSSLKLPPLPTPTAETPPPQVEVVIPSPTPKPTFTPSPTPTPKPTPTAKPTPAPEPPEKPHVFITNATEPEDMTQYGVASLIGEVQTDKGVVVKVVGEILDSDGNVVQEYVDYPYAAYYSIAGTVNAALRFGQLLPGRYTYRLTAIAENESYSDEQVLTEKEFNVFPG